MDNEVERCSKLSLMNNTTRIEVMRFLDKLGTIFYSTKDDRLPLVAFKCLNWTMKHGYCDYSSVTFACVGLIMTGAINDLPGGSKYCEQALTLLERSKSHTTASRTIFCVYGFSFAYTKPIRSLLKPLLRGYDIGLQMG